MNAFTLLPKAWYSSDYRVLQGGVEITRLKFETGPERSVFSLGGPTYVARKEKWSSPNFFLTLNEFQLARAEKPSAFSQTMKVECQDHSYILKPKFNRFILSQQDRQVGLIAKQAWFSRKAAASLPEELSQPLSVFVIWLALLMWKRDADSSATTAAVTSTT